MNLTTDGNPELAGCNKKWSSKQKKNEKFGEGAMLVWTQIDVFI